MYEPSANNQVASSAQVDAGGNLGLSVTAQRRRELQLQAEQQYQEQVSPLSTRNGDEVAL
ncbi:hypothetical protein KR084_010552 [Drosophila pseudotakahashii]|nr:hypothetical protein KR084_010552 [Drosophila pseudotakahashii]